MPGFLSFKDFAAADGESVSIVEFESLETLERANPKSAGGRVGIITAIAKRRGELK